MFEEKEEVVTPKPETNNAVEDIIPNKKSGCMKYVFMSLLALLLVGGAIFWWKFYYTYSDGARSGMLQKLSHKGNLFKTYEGELVLSSVASTSNVALASEKFFFSVANDSIAKKMMEYEGKRVKLQYQEKKGSLPWRGDSKYLVDGVMLEQ